MAKNLLRENVPLSRFGVLVAQLESIVASASQQPPDPLLSFDLLSDLISSIDEEPKETILLWQRTCEDALYSLLVLGARRPVRHLASLAMARIISKGDTISIYSRVSSLQGFLSDAKKNQPLRAAGAAQCLGELYRHFGRRITSGLLETTNIASKLMRFSEDFVRQEALEMLQNALEGSGGNASSAAYTEAFRIIMRIGVGDKSFIIKIAAAKCLKTFASIGGPGLGIGELESSSSYCIKALEDHIPSVREAFAEALGALLALGMNPEAQVQPKGKSHSTTARKLDGCLQKYLASPFIRASGIRAKEVRIGITLSWVFFLQAIRLKYLHPDSELSDYALQAVDMLGGNSTLDAHALVSSLKNISFNLACVLYILRVGVTDQMTESTQSSFLVLLGRQLEVPDHSPCMKVAVLRTLSYILTTLGEVPQEFKEILDDTIVSTLAHPEQLVRNEAALTLRALAEVDPTCVGGLISYAVTILNALRESISFEKGDNLKVELDSLHGQATVLAALVSISPKLPLGYPARLPQSVLDVSKKMLTETNSNPVASTIQKEAGWLLLASLIASMPKEELEDQVFDILSLWASNFNGDTESKIKQAEDLSEIRVWSAAIDALTAFIRCFICSSTTGFKDGILLPVLMYLGRALSYISALVEKHLSDMKPAVDLFIIKTLIACQSLSDPMTYKSDHPQILQICTTPFRDPSGCEESSCLRLLLDQRDACLGPWIPGRDWFEDELRAFEGGKDGLMPCVWEHELSTFPQPETTNKMLVNQMLLCFGILFAIQDSAGMLSLLGTIDQCVKAGKKQPWHSVSVTNVCVGLLAGFKALLCLRPPPLAVETLSAAQTIFQGILAEGEISAAQRRACSEGLGLLARLGNDIFTARMTQSLLGDLVGARDPSYTGSVALSLGCIHRSAGGMALSTMVPATVSSVSLLAKSPRASLQIWSLHGLLLTIEAAGLSYVPQVQETLSLAMEILLSEESGWIELHQGIGRLINAIVAVLGPELAPGSIFFSRCKSVVAEISSGQETSTLLESVRFTQQLVLFAPQAVSVRSHVQTLLPTLSSRQPTLRHLAVSTLWHLIEKDPVAINQEQIDENLFHMLDEETDTEIGNLVRTTITRLLCTSCPSCPSHWISICRKMILSTSTTRSANSNNRVSEHDTPNDKDGDARQYFGEDDGNIVSSSKVDVSNRDTYLRYRTRVFAAECLRHVPTAVGKDPAHFDLSLARSLTVNEELTGDWLVLQIQELIAVAYQISTIQFENMQPIGVNLLCTIIDKFKDVEDPDLPGHFLMEQYQAQLVSAIRTALGESSSPFLLEAGLHLATKILMSSIISGNQAAVKRIFSLISRPLNDIEDLYYPSFAEWVECKIKIRLLAAHASFKSYIYAFLRRQHSKIPDEYLGLLPQFAKSSSVLGKYWISILKYYQYTCFHLKPNSKYKSFLDGIQSPLISSKLQQCLEEAWPVILQAIALDAVPEKPELDESSTSTQEVSTSSLISGYQMVKLEPKEFRFLWGFTLLIMFERQQPVMGTNTEPLPSPYAKCDEDLMHEETNCPSSLYCETALLVFQSLSEERFFRLGFLTSNICKELLQVFAYSAQLEVPWTSLVVRVLSQIVQVCPNDYFETEGFASMATEICITYLYETLQSCDDTSQDHPKCQHLFPPIFLALEKLMHQFEAQMKMTMVLAFTLTSYSCLRVVASESCVSKVIAFVQSMEALLKKHVGDKAKNRDDHLNHLMRVLGVWQTETTSLAKDCMERMLENMNTEPSKLMKMKLSFCFQQAFSLTKLTHEAQLLGESHGNYQINCPLYINCTKCIKMVLNDSNMQVQRIGLQILRSMALKELGEGSDAKNQSFFMFFSAELFGDIFNLARKMKKLVTKDSVAITGECLTLLFIFLTLYKVGECQKSLIILFLEVTAMLISSSVDDHSQEETEIRSTALRLVSHLAQISSLAVQFKDVLLALPETRRQQFQDIIRASINQDTDSAETRPNASPLIIKVPVQSKPGSKDMSQVRASESSQLVTDDKESFEEEEDWDAFQSFSAIADTTAAESVMANVASGPSSVDNKSVLQDKSSNRDDFCGHSLDDVKEVSDAQHLEGGDKKIILARVEEGNDIKELYDSPPNGGMSMASANHLNEHEETKTSEDQDFQVSAKLQMVEDQEGLRKEKLLGDSEQKIDRCGNGGNFLHASSDPLPLEYQEPGTGEVSCEGSEKLASDLGCTNDIQEGLEKENLPEDSEQKSKCSEIGVNDLHASSDPLDLKYAQETSNEAEVVSVEGDTMVSDLNHANNVEGLKNEKSIDEPQYKIHIGSEGNIWHASSDTVPFECAQEVGSKAEAAIDGNEMSVRDIDFSNNLHEGLEKEKSRKHSDQKLKESRSVGNDLHASSGPQVFEYYKEPSRETEVAIEGNEMLVKDIHFSNDVQKGLEKEKSCKYSEKKLEKSGSGGHDLQISSGLLPLEYDQETNKETEVAIEGCEMLVMDIDIVNDIQEGLENEKSLKYSEQKMEKRGSGGNDLHASSASVPFEYAQVPDASSGPLPLAYAQEPGRETGVAIEGREMLVKDIEFADDIQEGLEKEKAHEYSEQKMEKGGNGSNDLQAPMSPLPLEYAQGSGCEADVATEGRETLVKDIDFANDIQEVLEKEKALEYSVQKMEKGASRGNNLHAPSGPLPLECAEEQDTKAEISSGGNGELIGDVECKTKTKDARPLECAEELDTEAEISSGGDGDARLMRR